MTSETHQAAIERIRKLLRMTVANGCTEAEAIAAAEKVARLMAELRLAPGDIDMEAEKVRKRRGAKSLRATLWASVAVCTNTGVMINFETIDYLGRAPGPEIAAYLHAITDRAVDRELKLFRATTWYKRRRTVRAKRLASDDFTSALVNRLAGRLLDLFAATISSEERALAMAELERRHRTAKVTLREAPDRYYDAYSAGRKAADGVNLAHGMAGGGRAPTLLGRAE